MALCFVTVRVKGNEYQVLPERIREWREQPKRK